MVLRIIYKKIWKIDWSNFFRITNEMDFDFDAVGRFQAYQAQRRYLKIASVFPSLKI